VAVGKLTKPIVKDGAAAFLMKSGESLVNNSLPLIQTLQSLLA
jgi:hypothetical protein